MQSKAKDGIDNPKDDEEEGNKASSTPDSNKNQSKQENFSD